MNQKKKTTNANGRTISGPYTHANLTVFLVHSPDHADTNRYATLEIGRAYV